MDGRVQKPVYHYMKEHYGIDYVDTVTEPGPCKILAENLDAPVIDDIKKRVEISVNKHGAKVVAIVAHEECAGNPVSKEEQMGHLKKAKEIFTQSFPDVEIVLLWVGHGWDKAELID